MEFVTTSAAGGPLAGNPTLIISNWRKTTQEIRSLHLRAAQIFRLYHMRLQYPIVFLHAVLGALSVASVTNTSEEGARSSDQAFVVTIVATLLLAFSVLHSFLSRLQTGLNWNILRMQHLQRAAECTKLASKCQRELLSLMDASNAILQSNHLALAALQDIINSREELMCTDNFVPWPSVLEPMANHFHTSETWLPVTNITLQSSGDHAAGTGIAAKGAMGVRVASGTHDILIDPAARPPGASATPNMSAPLKRSRFTLANVFMAVPALQRRMSARDKKSTSQRREANPTWMYRSNSSDSESSTCAGDHDHISTRTRMFHQVLTSWKSQAVATIKSFRKEQKSINMKNDRINDMYTVFSVLRTSFATAFGAQVLANSDTASSFQQWSVYTTLVLTVILYIFEALISNLHYDQKLTEIKRVVVDLNNFVHRISLVMIEDVGDAHTQQSQLVQLLVKRSELNQHDSMTADIPLPISVTDDLHFCELPRLRPTPSGGTNVSLSSPASDKETPTPAPHAAQQSEQKCERFHLSRSLSPRSNTREKPFSLTSRRGRGYPGVIADAPALASPALDAGHVTLAMDSCDHRPPIFTAIAAQPKEALRLPNPPPSFHRHSTDGTTPSSETSPSINAASTTIELVGLPDVEMLQARSLSQYESTHSY
jgi:hypothetical protein